MPQHAQQNYVAEFQGVRVTPSPFEQIVQTLWPKATHRELIQTFNNRVPYVQIWEWRTGRRNPPAWARSIVRSCFEAWKAEGDTALANLGAERAQMELRKQRLRTDNGLSRWKAQQNL